MLPPTKYSLWAPNIRASIWTEASIPLEMREALQQYCAPHSYKQYPSQAIHNSVAYLLQFCAKIILFFRRVLENYAVPSERWRSQKIAAVGVAR